MGELPFPKLSLDQDVNTWYNQRLGDQTDTFIMYGIKNQVLLLRRGGLVVAKFTFDASFHIWICSNKKHKSNVHTTNFLTIYIYFTTYDVIWFK
jgi:hypothetical protein